MCDAFADALAADNHGEFIHNAVAHSQAGENTATTAIDSDEETKMINEEYDAAAQCAEPGTTLPMLAPQGSKRQRLSAKEQSQLNGPPAKKPWRRRVNPLLQLKFSPLKESNGCPIRSIFVPRKKGEQEAIPLWPQYHASWKTADFDKHSWLVVSNQSRWFYHLVNAVTNRCVRDVAQDLFNAVRTEFSACLTKARGSLGDQDSQSCDSDSDTAELNPRLNINKQAAAVVLVIGGYSVFCINHRKQMLIAVDDDSVEFIRHWLLPLAQQSARCIGTTAPVQPVEPACATKLGGFQFSANPTPNIRGKITWNPAKHAWKLLAQKPNPKMLPLRIFAINPELPATEYLAAKSLEYRLAIEAWNTCDRSSRHRIKPPTVLLEEGVTTSGSQPSSGDSEASLGDC